MLAINLLNETHNASDITWLLWVALGFFGLMVVVGWLVSRNQKTETDNHSAHPGRQEEHHGHG